MPEKLTHQEYVATQRAQAARVAREALAGTRSVLEAVRLIVRSGLEVEENDPDIALLESIEDQTEHLPIGSERTNWQPAALERKTQELVDAEEWAKRSATDALRNIATRFGAV
jgi:hypothetical protein